MKVDKKMVDEIAHLARLEFDAEQKEKIIKDMNNILTFVGKLNELNTDNVEPLIHMTDSDGCVLGENDEMNALRDDEFKNDITQDDALKNAPKKDSDYFRVPKVIAKK